MDATRITKRDSDGEANDDDLVITKVVTREEKIAQAMADAASCESPHLQVVVSGGIDHKDCVYQFIKDKIKDYVTKGEKLVVLSPTAKEEMYKDQTVVVKSPVPVDVAAFITAGTFGSCKEMDMSGISLRGTKYLSIGKVSYETCLVKPPCDLPSSLLFLSIQGRTDLRSSHFKNLTSLRHLYLEDVENVAACPASWLNEIGKIRSLKTIHVEVRFQRGSMAAILTQLGHRKMENLTSISIIGLCLARMPRFVFCDVLEYVNLSSNFISELDMDDLPASMKKLDVTYNPIVVVSGRKVKNKMEEILMRYTHVKETEYVRCMAACVPESCIIHMGGSIRLHMRELTKSFMAGDLEGILAQSQTPLDANKRRERDNGGWSSCVICMDSDRDTLLSPCNHLVTCSECSKMVTRCPYCRATVRSKTKIVIPK